MPRSNKPNKSKDSKKSSNPQPRNRNRNRSSTTNNNGSAVQRGGGNSNNGSGGGNPTNGSRRTSDSNSSALVARHGGGGDPRRPGFVRGRYDLGAWLEEAGAPDSSAANGGVGGSNSNRRTLTAPGGSSGGGGGGGSGCFQESLAIPDFSSSSLSRLNFGNLSADEQRSLAEYFYTGVQSAQRLHFGNDRRFDRHLQLSALITQKTLESEAMARRGLQAINSLRRDVEGLGNTSAQHERRLNALEEQLAQANQQDNDTDSEEDSEGEDSDA